jgi:protein-disulfide isomerase
MLIARKAAWFSALTWAALLVVAAALPLDLSAAPTAKPSPPSLKSALLDDPGSPVVGNPAGDVTVVAFTDYNCPYCRKSEGDLAALIASDAKVRVVYKDWPILAKSSVTAAKIAIAAHWQGKYAAVHQALMRMHARPATDQDISQAVVASGVDVAQLNRDLDKRDDEIVALLKRNMAEADALKLQGTPVYIIGPFLEASALDVTGFKRLVSDARKERAAAEPR